MKKSSVYFVQLLVLLTQIGCILCACELEVLDGAPIFTTNFGSRKIVFKATTPTLQFEEDEILHAHCSTKITLSIRTYRIRNTYPHEYQYYNSDKPKQAEYDLNEVADIKQMVTLRCNSNDQIEYMRKVGESVTVTNSKSAVISCSTRPNLSLYESKAQLPNCEGHMSYALGVQLPDVGEFVTSGICYDIQTLTLKYANYIADDAKTSFVVDKTNLSNPLIANFGQKLKNLPNYFKFMRDDDLNTALNLVRKETSILKPFEYAYVSLLQNIALQDDLSDYYYIFKTIWWNQLRQNNWQYFLEALEKRTKTHKYIVYVGTHGNATIPTDTGTCNHTEPFVVKSGNLAVTAPAYIWAYLKSLDVDSEQEEFVVIAHNSPFALNPNSSAFCEDICDGIAWLRESKFGNMRQIPTLGHTFCCRPEEVAKVIEHFPLPPKPHEDNSELENSSSETSSTAKP